jgi:hypothetical protein
VPPSRAPVLPTVIEVADGVAIVRCALAVGVIAIPAGWLATGIWVPVVFVDTVISVTVPASLVASTVFPSGVIAIPYARQTSSAGAEVLPESRRQRSGQRQLRLPRLARTGVPTAEKGIHQRVRPESECADACLARLAHPPAQADNLVSVEAAH